MSLSREANLAWYYIMLFTQKPLTIYKMLFTAPSSWECVNIINLCLKDWNCGGAKALVKKSTNCCEPGMKRGWIKPSLNLLRIVWQPISVCLVRSWKVGLEVIWMTHWLSKLKGDRLFDENLKVLQDIWNPEWNPYFGILPHKKNERRWLVFGSSMKWEIH